MSETVLRRLGWSRLSMTFTSIPRRCTSITKCHDILATGWLVSRSLVHAVPDEMPEMLHDATCTFAFGASRSSATSSHIFAVSYLLAWAHTRSIVFSTAMQSQSVQARAESHYQASCSGCTQRIPHVLTANVTARSGHRLQHDADQKRRRRHPRLYRSVAKQVRSRQHPQLQELLDAR